MGFGLKGDLVANTPTLWFPPSLGGLTVGLKVWSSGVSENPQRSQIWEKPSRPLTAFASLYSYSNTILEMFRASPLCLGMPNFSV